MLPAIYANALGARARLNEGALADELFDKAIGKFREVLEKQPNNAEVLEGLGWTLCKMAEIKSGEQANTLYAEACFAFESADRSKPNDEVILASWAIALFDRALYTSGEDAESLRAQGTVKFEAAWKCNPKNATTLFNWGSSLHSQIDHGGKDAKALFLLAEAKYEAAISINPEMHDVRFNLALLRMSQALNEADPRACELLNQAKIYLLSVKPVDARVVYNLACVYASLGEENEAREQLKWLRDNGWLHPKEIFLEERHFNSIREEDWFREVTGQN
jgi:tetratricopeptide (TPR) repeat protein